jgi:hypothetical protein
MPKKMPKQFTVHTATDDDLQTVCDDKYIPPFIKEYSQGGIWISLVSDFKSRSRIHKLSRDSFFQFFTEKDTLQANSLNKQMLAFANVIIKPMVNIFAHFEDGYTGQVDYSPGTLYMKALSTYIQENGRNWQEKQQQQQALIQQQARDDAEDPQKIMEVSMKFQIESMKSNIEEYQGLVKEYLIVIAQYQRSAEDAERARDEAIKRAEDAERARDEAIKREEDAERRREEDVDAKVRAAQAQIAAQTDLDEEHELCLTILENEIKRLRELGQTSIAELEDLIQKLQGELHKKSQTIQTLQGRLQTTLEFNRKLRTNLSQRKARDSNEVIQLRAEQVKLLEQLQQMKRNKNALSLQVSSFEAHITLLSTEHANMIAQLKQDAVDAKAKTEALQTTLEDKLRETEALTMEQLERAKQQVLLEERLSELQSSTKAQTSEQESAIRMIRLDLQTLQGDKERTNSELDDQKAEVSRLQTAATTQSAAAKEAARQAETELRDALAAALQHAQQTHLGQLERVKTQYTDAFELAERRMKEVIGMWNDSSAKLDNELTDKLAELKAMHEKQISQLGSRNKALVHQISQSVIKVVDQAFAYCMDMNYRIDHSLVFHMTPQAIATCINLSLYYMPNFEEIKLELFNKTNGKCANPECPLKDSRLPALDDSPDGPYCELSMKTPVEQAELFEKIDAGGDDKYSNLQLLCYYCDRLRREKNLRGGKLFQIVPLDV